MFHVEHLVFGNSRAAYFLRFGMSKTICVVNQKGGVGKTTTSVNLSYALSNMGKRVLLVDLDPQANASGVLGIEQGKLNQDSRSIYDVLIGALPLKEAILDTTKDNLKAIVSNSNLVGAEVELVGLDKREFRLKNALLPISHLFDFIIIDCPPSLGLLTVNGLVAANSFLVPLQCEYYALEGLSRLITTSSLIRHNLNPSLKLEGVLLTMFDTRNKLSHQVAEEVRKHFNEKVFETIIPRSVRMSEAPSHGTSIFEYDKNSVGATKYRELGLELVKRTSEQSHLEVSKKDKETRCPQQTP